VVRLVERTADLIILLGILMFMIAFITHNLTRAFVFKEIGRAMCNGKNALDGNLYTRIIDNNEVYILRCIFLVAPKSAHVEEVVIGWMER